MRNCSVDRFTIIYVNYNNLNKTKITRVIIYIIELMGGGSYHLLTIKLLIS